MTPEPPGPFRLGIPHLRNLPQAMVMLQCESCGKSTQSIPLAPGEAGFGCWIFGQDRLSAGTQDILRGHMQAYAIPGRFLPIVGFEFAYTPDDGTVWPLSEGRVQDATVIDQHGDPDRMVEFAEEYLRQHRILIRPGSLPQSLTAMMPSLLLLVTAAELVLKAFEIRSGRPQSRSHGLVDVYQALRIEHRTEIENRFGRLEGIAALKRLGMPAPSVVDVLGRYTVLYGGSRGVHVESRYFAEPTSMLPKSSNWHNANLVKTNTPYPVFMPQLVEILIESYRHFSGHLRLRRRGAAVRERKPDSGSRGHGDWELVPASLGLGVFEVEQSIALDGQHNERPDYQQFTRSHNGYHLMDWMYGGSKLHYYATDGTQLQDGSCAIDGIKGYLTVNEHIGVHPRDLALLADRLDRIDAGSEPLAPLPPVTYAA